MLVDLWYRQDGPDSSFSPLFVGSQDAGGEKRGTLKRIEEVSVPYSSGVRMLGSSWQMKARRATSVSVPYSSGVRMLGGPGPHLS